MARKRMLGAPMLEPTGKTALVHVTETIRPCPGSSHAFCRGEIRYRMEQAREEVLMFPVLCDHCREALPSEQAHLVYVVNLYRDPRTKEDVT